MGKFQTLIISM